MVRVFTSFFLMLTWVVCVLCTLQGFQTSKTCMVNGALGIPRRGMVNRGQSLGASAVRGSEKTVEK